MAGESLKVVAGNATGSTIALESELVVGRSTPGLGSLGGDSEISRVHARIFHDPSGQLMIEDLGSTNGTFVNGARIAGQQPLRSGDQVRVGQTTMTVEGGAAGGATAIGAIVPPAAAATPPPPAAVAAAPPTQPLPPAQPPPPQPGYGQQPPAYGQPPGPGFAAGGPISGPPARVSGGSKGPWIALAVVVVIALVVGGLAIGGVFSGDDDSKQTASTSPITTPTVTTPAPAATTPAEPPPSAMPEPPSNEPAGGGYPSGFGKSFVDSCSSSGRLSRSQCQCWFGKLRREYTFPEFVDVLKKARAGNTPPKAVALLRECVQ